MAFTPTVAGVNRLVQEIFDQRGGAGHRQASTAAIGVIKGQNGIFVAKQSGPICEAEFRNLRLQANGWEIVDARHIVETVRNLSEWTGYHAEMIIVAAMISANIWHPATLPELKALILSRRGAVICANAQSCHHCGSFMDQAGIEYFGDKGGRTNTAWWNPINDGRYENGSNEFSKDVPGF